MYNILFTTFGPTKALLVKPICVFCGADLPAAKCWRKPLSILRKLWSAGIVHGVGRWQVGVMGIWAYAVLNPEDKATGVIPQFLMDRKVGHTGSTELHIVDNMHQRKQLMNDLGDRIIILPGGIETLN